MSNLIKSNYVVMNQGNKRIIDSDNRKDGFIPMMFQKIEISSEQEQVSQEAGAGNNNSIEQEEEIRELADEIIEEAKEKAEIIILEAKEEALSLKENIFEEARKMGYEEGMKESDAMLRSMEVELQQKKEEVKREYEERYAVLESELTDIMISLIKKITGIVMEDKREIILHLVEQAAKSLGRCEHFLIRVSKEDYLILEDNRDRIYAAVHNEAKIEFVEDKTFAKNQCIIEADSKMIDCSLDVQIENLTDALRLLSLK